MNHNDDATTAAEMKWPDSLDAMLAAPEHHEGLLENERVRIDRLIKPN